MIIRDAEEQSFLVHMQSLTDFTRELDTQLDGLGKPVGDLAQLAAAPFLLGEFSEAHGFVAAHQGAIARMDELLGAVQVAIEFASEVTQVVAERYREADHVVADALGIGD